MPNRGTLVLEVYEVGGEIVDWSVSSDDGHVRPYLIGPQNYEAQEIDPVAAAATIGTVEVGVIDPAQDAGDQDSGWMTQRVGSIRGRRCRLRRYIDEVTGYVTIADGPAGTARLDPTYSAYRWPIRDTREIERKLSAFNVGGVCGIAPWGPIAGFGYDADEDEWLVDPIDPLLAAYQVNEGSQYGIRVGFVDFAWTGAIPGGAPPDGAIVEKEGEAALQGRPDGLFTVFPYADVLWRVAGSEDPWNVARPRFPAPYNQNQLPLALIQDGVVAGENVRGIQRLFLWALPLGTDGDELAPFGADAVAGVGTGLEIVVRHRGKASEELPFFFEGTAASLISALYNGELSGVDPISEAARDRGDLYDPAGFDTTNLFLAGGVKYDAEAVDQMTAPVLLRQTEGVDDGRAWAEEQVYGPSGWIPALDGEGLVSPVSRARPAIVTGPLISGTIAEPSPDWNTGERVVTRVEFDYPRYFRPTYPFGIETDRAGIAIQPIHVVFIDADAESTEGQRPQTYDATPFGAIGSGSGQARAGKTETGAILSQEARYEVLARYRAGAQAFPVRVLRSGVPFVRVGDWCPAQIAWLPNTETGRRGLDLPAVQVLSIDDSEYAWRNMLLEESSVASPPGYFDSLELISDEVGAGYIDSLEMIDDTEDP